MPNWLIILHCMVHSNSYCSCSYTLFVHVWGDEPNKGIAKCEQYMHALHGVAGSYTCAGKEYPLQTHLNLIFPAVKLHVHVHIGKAWFNSGCFALSGLNGASGTCSFVHYIIHCISMLTTSCFVPNVITTAKYPFGMLLMGLAGVTTQYWTCTVCVHDIWVHLCIHVHCLHTNVIIHLTPSNPNSAPPTVYRNFWWHHTTWWLDLEVVIGLHPWLWYVLCVRVSVCSCVCVYMCVHVCVCNTLTLCVQWHGIEKMGYLFLVK